MLDDRKHSISRASGGRRTSSESISKSAGVLEAALWTKGATTFDNDSGLQDFYKPINSYEGYHRYDPSYTWSKEDEKKVVRRIDFKICSWVCLMFFALQLDRGNISQALSDNMLDDLNITTNEYNTGMTIFYCSFLVAEVPSQLISKRLGPDRWIPIQMVSWSLVASLQAFLSGKSSFYACRSLLGLIEGGFIPDAILYMSYFYTSPELPIRLSYFWTAYQSTSVISAFLAYGILRLRGVNGMEGWRWLFALEGTLTGLIGIASAFYLPPSPTQTKSRFRGKDGWFTEHQEKIMVNRILRDDPSKGDMHNREGLNLKEIWLCLTDYHMWPIYLMGLTWLIPNHPMVAYLTLQLRSVGFDTFKTNLLTIPASALFIAQALFWTWLSEKMDQRFIVALISQVWSLPILIALAVIPSASSPWVKWILSTLLVGHPYAHAIVVAVTSRNAGTVRTRTFATAFYNMCCQASSIISSNIYREEDKPLYRTGNRILIGIAIYNIFLIAGTKFFYVYHNKIRAKKWDAMSGEEKENYLATTTDKGNKRLDFRFGS
ncbi:phthalate transporter [Eremomyces bilateralis CBS 781.70]|uniref:Phthalate transporter n=1 Tax=Eremomyces bilateralis CBS 781.70 TaxID=1392243 RepID=A0A6G1GHM7_9PEZI|nr:phthalate transporter [Eremomyces bilateralis CBS 781.70]KAF1817578.1 phthalate transporter [Eremomyces bilateralis CBS 781.70]